MYGEGERVFPYVLKRREAEAGTQVFIIRTPADEARYSALLMDDAYFCQAYIPGRLEYALHLLLVDGRIFYQSTNAYEMPGQYAVKGIALGPVNAVYGAESNPTAVDTLVEFLRSIDFSGVCCMDYKLVDGRLQILEINPRVGFTLYRDIDRFLPAYEQALGLGG
jgi:carbamoylphosphate synthase large subunit